MSDKKVKNIHQDHRSRLRGRFIKEGLDNFEPHNVLELLLFYSIPRKDTNGIAHGLMDHYKSLHAVFDADYEDLIKREGLGENSAALIKLIPAIAKRYLLDRYDDRMKFESFDQIGKYLVDYYCGIKNEVVSAIFLDNNLKMIDCIKISEGTPSESKINLRKIFESGMLKGAVTFILAHNHPGGTTEPSPEDERTTMFLLKECEMIGIPLLEHIIVAGNEYRCILNNRSPVIKEII